MQIVVPMTGRGSRFAAAGYKDIKPLIQVDGMPIIEHIVKQFPGEWNFIFICARDHLETTRLSQILKKLAPKGKIVSVDPHKKGPVWSALLAADAIENEKPTFLHYCDFAVDWNYGDFQETMKRLDPAGCVQAYRGFHPHLLGPNKYANMREKDGWMLEIKEKHIFTDNRFTEYSSSGAYYFQSGRLMKDTFKIAVNRNMVTNGEYYASTPFNILVEQGKPVWIYEVPCFMQWGTPEDLEEYQNWSDYFRYDFHWRPSGSAGDLQILVPMVGEGLRFKKEGYQKPKPIVSVAGNPMVARSLDSYPTPSRLICVMREEDANNHEIILSVKSPGRNVDIISVAQMTEGQACTCILGLSKCDLEKPVLIAPCDSAVIYDEERFRELSSDPNVDCIVWTFRNHPHANRNPNQYGWVKIDHQNKIIKISCKLALSENVTHDPGIIGIFWFRKAGYFLSAAQELINRNLRINNEFYADSVIDILVEQGLSAYIFDVRRLICFGVPSDVRTYEYWDAHFRRAAHHPHGK